MATTGNLTPRLIRQTVIWLAITGAVLFVSAGTLHWPQAWVLLAELGVLGLASGLTIAARDPALLDERMKPMLRRDQKGWDKVLLPVFLVLWLAQYVVAGIDVRLGISSMPPWLNVVGALSVAFGLYIAHIAMITNSFASAVVRVQTERQHRVVSTGPYAHVRHPMYSGALGLVLGTPLLLGSWYAAGVGILIVAVLACRAVLEEITLKQELDGYAAYAARVRWRFIPGVW